MLEKKIKIGVMGCANIARASVIPAIIANPNYELVAVASRTKEKAEEFSSLFNCDYVVGYDNLLELDVDALYIPLPTGLHEEWVMKSLERGKHTLVEKSFGSDLASTQRILELAMQNELVCMENFMFPYHNQHQVVLDLLKNGSIGKIRSFKATFSFPPLPYDNFRYNRPLGGGALLDAAAYTVKAAQVFLGSELQFLSATMNEDAKRAVDITGSAHFFYKQSIPVHLTWGFDNYYQCGIDVLGTRGKLSTNRTFTAKPGFIPKAIVETPEGIVEHDLPEDDHFQKMLNVFAKRMEDGLFKESAEEILQQSTLLEEIRTQAIKGVYA